MCLVSVSNGFSLPYILWLFMGPFIGKTCRFLVCPLVFQDSGYKLDNMPEWRNGRRTRLKIWHPFGYTGSTPVSGIDSLSGGAYGQWLMAYRRWAYILFSGIVLRRLQMWMTDEELEELAQSKAIRKAETERIYREAPLLLKIICHIIGLSPLIYAIIWGIVDTLKQKGIIAP